MLIFLGLRDSKLGKFFADYQQSHNIKFRTAETIPIGTFTNIAKAIRKLIGMYTICCLDGQSEGISE